MGANFYLDHERVVVAGPASVAAEARAGAQAKGSLGGGGAHPVFAAQVLHRTVPGKGLGLIRPDI